MKTKNMTTLHSRKSIGRLPWALAVCLTLATLGLGLSASANERETRFITFDVPGAAQGTTDAIAINPAGAIAGFYLDASNVNHSFLRGPDGAFTTFDPPGEIASAASSINPAGAIAGPCRDASSVHHGYLRAPNGTFTTFDAPGAGTGSDQGTFAQNINPASAISGYYLDASNVIHGFVRTPSGAITTFDAPGAGTGPFQGTATTSVDGMNPAGATVGQYLDASNVFHGFVRAPNGTITTFDAPGAGTGAFQGTGVNGINPAGTMLGPYIDASNVFHGFVRAPNGTITTFDVLGAGTGPARAPPPLTSIRKARLLDSTMTLTMWCTASCGIRTAPSPRLTPRGRARAPARAPTPNPTIRRGRSRESTSMRAIWSTASSCKASKRAWKGQTRNRKWSQTFSRT